MEVTDVESAARAIAVLERRLETQEKRTADINQITAFDGSSVLVGLGIGIKAGTGITITKSGPFLVVTAAAGGFGSPVKIGTANAAGAAGTAPRSDHVHDGLGEPQGLTGATAATRYVGGTASGAPMSGTFLLGDFVIDQSGAGWVCTAAGTPGTWKSMGPRTLDITKLIGTLTVIGHSYIAGSTQADSGTPNVYQESVIAKLQGLLGIHDQNVTNLGQAASAISMNRNVISSSVFSGWSSVLQFVWPSNSGPVNAQADVVITDPVDAVNGAFVIVHGCNDLCPEGNAVVADNNQRAQNGRVAGANAIRTVLSRLRAGVVYCLQAPLGVIASGWDPSIVFGGVWTAGNVASLTQNSGAGYRATTNGFATFTITVPQNFRGGVIGINLIGQANGVTHITDNPLTIGAATLNVASGAEFPTSGTIAIQIDNEQMVATPGVPSATNWGITRGVNGTVAAAHAQNAVLFVAGGTPVGGAATPTHGVTWSGTVFSAGSNPPHPETHLGGQGRFNSPVSVVTRFALTSADAGKTIIGTMHMPLAATDTSAQVIFDSWWYESPTPPPAVITNVQDWAFLAFPISFDDNPYVVPWNTMLSGVVAEFDGFVQIADVYTVWWKRNGFLANNALNNTTGGIIAGVAWTANDPSFTPVVGMKMLCYPNNESFVLTAVSGSYPNWTFSVQRGPIPVAHPSGEAMRANDWMHTDIIHLNSHGHAVFAQTIYDAFTNMPVPAQYQMAEAMGNWSQGAQSFRQGITDNWFQTSRIAGLNAGTPTLDQMYAVPIDIEKMCVVTEIGVESTGVGGVNAALRFGIFAKDTSAARPGRLVQYFGEKNNNGLAASTTCGLTGRYQVLRPGRYWVAVYQHVASTQVRTIAALTEALMSDAALSASQVTGYSRPVLAAEYNATPPMNDWSTWTVETNTTVVPRIYVRLRAAQYA